MKDTWMNRGLVVSVILLFIGVAISPGVTASVAKDKTIQFDVELCGLNQNYSVQLTPKQTQEVYAVFDTVKQKLSMIETQEESVAIFSEAINKLHTIGLLGEMEVSRIINLVLQPTMNPRFVQTILVRSHKLTNEGNYLCSIAGNTSNAYFCGTSLRMLNVVMTLPFFVFHKLGIGTMIQEGLVKLLEILAKIASPLLTIIIDILFGLFDPLILQMLIHFLATLTVPFVFLFYLLLMIPTGWTDIPWILMNIYDFKDWICSAIMIGNDRWGPSVGWVNTVGKNGNVNWNGSLWGQLPLLPQVVSIPQLDKLYFYYPGIMGFRGIKVWCEERQDWSYIGNALWVNLGPERPENPWMLTPLI
jgi:hypothetical protein